jgi:hypothetical protein
MPEEYDCLPSLHVDLSLMSLHSEIIRLARKYAQQKNKSHAQRFQCGYPKRAVSKRELNSKRKNSPDSDEDYVQSKRARSASESEGDDS